MCGGPEMPGEKRPFAVPALDGSSEDALRAPGGFAASTLLASSSGLGALGYAFAGPVLFQYCNVIYLVGAAWVPLGVLAADRWLRLGSRPAVLGLAAVLAMEALGGDPESAYLSGLCAVGYAVAFGCSGHADFSVLLRQRLPRSIAFVALAGLGAGLGVLPAVGFQTAAHVVALVESALSIPADEPLVGTGVDQFPLGGFGSCHR